MTVTSEKDLVAIGVLAARLQRSVRVIEAACLELNIAPALRINYVPHFDGEQVELLTERLADAGRELPRMLDARGCVPELHRPY
jgi:hypothetical protein